MPAKRNQKSKAKSAPKAQAPKEQPQVSERSVTGVLTSRESSRDIKVEGFCLIYHGKDILVDAELELNYGQRYGLIGANGSGKSILLQAVAAREIPIPSHIDIFLLQHEAQPSDRTAVQAVTDEAEKKIIFLEKEAEELAVSDPESVALQDIYERIEDLDPATMVARACHLLKCLGFSHELMNKKTRDLSGGWRMRVALAKALFVKPTLLLLDEPTNHLDLETCVWLETYLASYPRILVVVSHSQDFLNGVCSNIIFIRNKTLNYYGGNYDSYVRTRAEIEVNQMKHYKKQQDDIAHLNAFIRSCGTYSNLVRQAKSKQKIIDKMEAAGLVEEVVPDKVFKWKFEDPGTIPPPVLSFVNVAFSYSGDMKEALYTNINFGVDLDSRIALVGPNGAGKSTLLKLMVNELQATAGDVSRHNHLRIGRYHQHSAETLIPELCTLEFIKKQFPNIKMEEEQWRATIGRYGITGPTQLAPIGTLSDGQKTRVLFACIILSKPHLLLLDEPTNHLDMDMIDSLAGAINEYKGGLVLVSHDFRLITQVAKEIWVCDHKKVKKYQGDILKYKSEVLSRANNM